MMPGKAVTYGICNGKWNFPPEWVNSYYVPLGEKELGNLHWGPAVLLQAGPLKCTIPYYTTKHEPF